MMVRKLVRVPPSQRWVTLGMPIFSAASRMASWACRLVPTKRILPPRAAVSVTNSEAFLNSRSVCCRSMMWMPLRCPKMYFFILGFHLRVRCPKWTPASSSSFMVTVANVAS